MLHMYWGDWQSRGAKTAGGMIVGLGGTEKVEMASGRRHGLPGRNHTEYPLDPLASRTRDSRSQFVRKEFQSENNLRLLRLIAELEPGWAATTPQTRVAGTKVA